MVGPYRSASYFDLHLEIDTKGKLNIKLYDKRHDFILPIVNFPFLSSNIPYAPAYGVYVSQLICYSRACGEYHDVLLDRASRLSRKLQKQGYVAPRLLSLLKQFYERHHVLVDRYEISVSQHNHFFCTFYFPNIIPKSSSCSYISVIFLWTKSSLHFVHIWCKSSDQSLKFIYIALHNILYCNLTFTSLHDSWHTNFYLAFQKSVSFSSKLFHLKVNLA